VKLGAIKHVLHVDPDRVTRYLVGQQLSRDATLVVDFATSGEEAIERLSKRSFSLVVCETTLPDMQGIAILRRLRKESDAGPGFIFLSADSRKAVRVEALSARADDYLSKPCDGDELLLRCQAILRSREFKARSIAPPSAASLAGDLSTLSFPDLIGTLAMTRRSGRLVVGTKRQPAQVCLSDGFVWSADYGSKSGAAVIHELMRDASGRFEFFETTGDPGPRMIQESVTELLLEGARLLDEGHLDKIKDRTSSGFGNTMLRDGLAYGPMPNPKIAQQFRRHLEDPYTLGELQYLSAADLRNRAQLPSGAPVKLTVLLIAARDLGARTLLSLASLPTEGLITAGMSTDPKYLSLSLQLRNDLELEILHVDLHGGKLEGEGGFLEVFQCSPSFAILVPPPNGLGGVAVASSIGKLLRELRVDSVVCAASADLFSESTRALVLSTKVQLVHHDLDKEFELREVLLSGLAAWGDRLSYAL
jgi:DNA-binding response OmpR family regulator